MTKRQRYNRAIQSIYARKDKSSVLGGIRTLRSLAATKYPAALMALGCFYDYGVVVKKSPRQAVRYYCMAAIRGDSGAQYNLGICLAFGYGIKRNIPAACKWFEAAAKQGQRGAKSRLKALRASKEKR